jgi:hypothetical protein
MSSFGFWRGYVTGINLAKAVYNMLLTNLTT